MGRKTLLLIILFAISMVHVYGNIYIDGNNVSKMDNIRFLELNWEKTSGNILTGLTIRYGVTQDNLAFIGKLTQKNGRKIMFRSIHEALNHIRKNGWKDIKNFVKCSSGKSAVHFLFGK